MLIVLLDHSFKFLLSLFQLFVKKKIKTFFTDSQPKYDLKILVSLNVIIKRCLLIKKESINLLKWNTAHKFRADDYKYARRILSLWNNFLSPHKSRREKPMWILSNHGRNYFSAKRGNTSASYLINYGTKWMFCWDLGCSQISCLLERNYLQWRRWLQINLRFYLRR